MRYTVTIERVEVLTVEAPEAEAAVDLALGAIDPKKGLHIIDTDTETMGHTVEEEEGN